MITGKHFWQKKAIAWLNEIEDVERRKDYREYFEERAAIREFEGNIQQDEAERMAFDELKEKVLRDLASTF